RLVAESGSDYQDLLMVSFPTLPFGTISKNKEMLQLLERNSPAAEVLRRLSTGAMRISRDAIAATGHTPDATVEGLGRGDEHVLGETYYTQGALRFGDHNDKLSLAPASDNVRAVTGEKMQVDDLSAIRDLLVDYFREAGAEYELRAQLCTDVDATPVAEAADRWGERACPSQAEARP